MVVSLLGIDGKGFELCRSNVKWATVTNALIIVWSIIAHPPIPPENPVMLLATPCPKDSRVLLACVSVTLR